MTSSGRPNRIRSSHVGLGTTTALTERACDIRDETIASLQSLPQLSHSSLAVSTARAPISRAKAHSPILPRPRIFVSGLADQRWTTTQPHEMASGYLLHRHSGVSPWCAGVLVDPSTVLTAAHCVEDVSARDLSVGFGPRRIASGLPSQRNSAASVSRSRRACSA